MSLPSRWAITSAWLTLERLGVNAAIGVEVRPWEEGDPWREHGAGSWCVWMDPEGDGTERLDVMIYW